MKYGYLTGQQMEESGLNCGQINILCLWATHSMPNSKEYTPVTDLIFLFRTAVYIPYFFQQGFMAQVLGMGHKPKQKIQSSIT